MITHFEEQLLEHTPLPLDVIKFCITPYLGVQEKDVREQCISVQNEIAWCSGALEVGNMIRITCHSEARRRTVGNLLFSRDRTTICNRNRNHGVWMIEGYVEKVNGFVDTWIDANIIARAFAMHEKALLTIFHFSKVIEPYPTATDVMKKGILARIRRFFSKKTHHIEYRVNLKKKSVTRVRVLA